MTFFKSFLPALLKGTLSDGIKKHVAQNRKNFRQALIVNNGKVLNDGLTWDERFAQEQVLLSKTQELLELFPASSRFLGKHIKYPEQRKKRLFFFSVVQPELKELRKRLCKSDTIEDINTTRNSIDELLKKYKYCPDIHALHAIQVFKDVANSGVDEKKIYVYKQALIEIAKAIYNGGDSIFNVTWFIKIYLKYLEDLNIKYLNTYKVIVYSDSSILRKHAAELRRRQIEIKNLLSLRDKLSSLNQLNKQLKKNSFLTEPVWEEEIVLSCKAFLKGTPSEFIRKGISANFILSVVMTLNLLFAKIPIMHERVEENLQTLPDNSRDVILQKEMIYSTMKLTSMRSAFAKGNKNEMKKQSMAFFNRCREIIENHLEHSLLRKTYEIDPFLKAAWLVKETKGIIPEKIYRKMLNLALHYSAILTGERGQVNTCHEQATLLNLELENIRLQHGW